MYRRPKFLEVLLEIREEMSRQAEYDVDLFAEKMRPNRKAKEKKDPDANEASDGRLRVKTRITTKLKTKI